MTTITASIIEANIAATVTETSISATIVSSPINATISNVPIGPLYVNPSVTGNFVSFSNLTGGQQDSGYSASSFALTGHTHSTDHAALSHLAYADAGHTGFQPAGSYLTVESDPVFIASAAYGISSGDISNWNGKQSALSFPLAANLGGTGIANAAGSTLTLGAATSITGGGTIALGGYTLTVPTSLTAAGLAIANIFTASQTISGSGVSLTQTIQADSSLIAYFPSMTLAKSNGAGSLSGGDRLGQINFTGAVSGSQVTAARIDVVADGSGAWSSGGNRNAYIAFATMVSYTGGLLERMRITSTGAVGIGVIPLAQFHTVVQTTTTNAVLEVGRFEARVSTASTGGAAGFGAGLSLYAETATDATYQQQARIYSSWYDATNATRKGDLVGEASDAGGNREGWRVRASGTAAMFSVLGATPIVRQAHIVDADGSLADVTSKFNTLLSYFESFGFTNTV